MPKSRLMTRLPISTVAACVTVFLSLSSQAETHLRVGLFGFPPKEGNPYTGTAVPSILALPAFYDGLTHIKRDGTLRPQLATGWTRESDLVWSLDLCTGVTFSNGEAFDSAAVVAAFKFLATDAGRATAVGREVAGVARAVADGSHKVILTTSVAVPLLPRLIAAVRIPAPAHWQELGPLEASKRPVGTGPFVVDNWTNARVNLTAHRQSWRPPRVDRLTLLLLPDQTARLQALQSGAIDIATSLGTEDKATVEALGGRFIATKSPGNVAISYVSLGDGPLSDKRVRQALNYAVNKQAIVDILLNGASVVASQMVPEQAVGFNPDLKPYPYDPERAKHLIAEAGFPDGFEMTIEVPSGVGVSADAWHSQIANDLRQVGIDVTLQQISSSMLVQRIYSGDWIGDAFTMSMDTMPALDALRPFRIHSCLWSAPWYCNPADTPLIKAAMSEGDPARRQEMTAELLRRYHEDPPGIYLFQMVGFTGLAAGVQNFVSDNGIYNFHEITVEAD